MRDPAPAVGGGLRDCDGFFEALAALHDGLSAEESLRLNSRLVLLMAAYIGDDDAVRGLLEAAARDLRCDPKDPD